MELNKNNSLNSYISNKIRVLIREYKKCPNCIVEALQKNNYSKFQYVPNDDLSILKEISEKSKKPIATIIDAIIITPILIEH